MPAPLGCYQLHLAMSYFKHHQSELYPCRYHQLPSFPESPEVAGCMGHPHLLDNVPHKCAAPMRNQLVGHFGKTTIIAFTARNKACFQRHKHISVRFSNNTELPKNRNSRDTAKNTATTIEASGQLSFYKVYFWKTSVMLSRRGGYPFDYKPIKAWKIPVIDKNLHNHPSRHNKSSIRYLLHSPQNSDICLVLSMKLLVS